MPTLYIIATPIGNLEDITLRALRVLSGVDMILCEDTRVTKKLLDKYEITTPTMSYNAHASEGKAGSILALLAEGKNLALVSDAGTPTISDPGVLLVSQARERLGDTIKIVPVPGPSALAAALSVSGVPSADFLFLGFLPHKKGRRTLFKEIVGSKRTVLFYESPHRIKKTLAVLAEALPPERRVMIFRELTKIHEEVVGGSAAEVRTYFEDHPEKVKGEFVVLVAS